MTKITPSAKLCFDLAKFQTQLSRRLDSRLGGLGFNELIILYHINQAEEQKIRRTDLADKVGLTASGVTRLLLLMEKVRLIKREINENDARSSLVSLTPAGMTKLDEGMERLEIFCEELVPTDKTEEVKQLSGLISELEKNV